jgi:hypothetical protein
MDFAFRDKRDKKSRSPETLGIEVWPMVLALGLRGGFSSARGLPKKRIFIREVVLRTCVLKFWAQREPVS